MTPLHCDAGDAAALRRRGRFAPGAFLPEAGIGKNGNRNGNKNGYKNGYKNGDEHYAAGCRASQDGSA